MLDIIVFLFNPCNDEVFTMLKGSTRTYPTTGHIMRYAKQIQAEFKLSWTAALAKAKAILAL